MQLLRHNEEVGILLQKGLFFRRPRYIDNYRPQCFLTISHWISTGNVYSTKLWSKSKQYVLINIFEKIPRLLVNKNSIAMNTTTCYSSDTVMPAKERLIAPFILPRTKC